MSYDCFTHQYIIDRGYFGCDCVVGDYFGCGSTLCDYIGFDGVYLFVCSAFSWCVTIIRMSISKTCLIVSDWRPTLCVLVL